MNETFYSLPRVAKLYGVGRTTVHNAVARGDIPAIRLGNMSRVRLSDIPQHIKDRWSKPQNKIEFPDGQKVYFIAADNGPIKIGLSRDPLVRLARLNTSSPIPLTLKAWRLGGREVEAEYHRAFAAHRMNGEWFHPHEDILAEITRLTAKGAR